MELKIEEVIGDKVEIKRNVMTVEIADYEIGLRQMLEAAQSRTTTATGNIVLTDADHVIQIIDPGGASRTVTLPAESGDNHGFLFFNTADANETLTIKNDGGSTLAVIYQDSSGWFVSSGTAWKPAGVGTAMAMISDLSMGQYSFALPAGEPAVDDTGVGIKEQVVVDTNAIGESAILCLAPDGNYDEADADAIATMKGLVLALESGTGTKWVLRYGKFRHDAWNWTPGDIMYVSTTQGTLTATPPNGEDDVIKAVGVALTDDCILWNPNETYITHTGG